MGGADRTGYRRTPADEGLNGLNEGTGLGGSVGVGGGVDDGVGLSASSHGVGGSIGAGVGDAAAHNNSGGGGERKGSAPDMGMGGSIYGLGIRRKDDVKNSHHQSSSSKPVAPPAKSVMNIVILLLAVAAFYSFSIASGILNKTATSDAMIDPTVLTLTHLLFAVVADGAFMSIQRARSTSRRAPVPWSAIMSAFWPVSLAVVLAKLTTYMSYESITMSLAHTAKATEPMWNVFLAYSLFQEKKPPLVVFTLIPIAVGVALACVGEGSFHAVGFCFALASAAFKVLQNICLKRVMITDKFSFFELHFYGAIASLGILAPFMLFQVLNNPTLFERLDTSLLLLSALVQFLASLSSYLVLCLLDHLSFTITNCVKRLLIIISGIVYFHSDLSFENVTGIGLAMLGVLAYNLAKQNAWFSAPAGHNDSTGAGTSASEDSNPEIVDCSTTQYSASAGHASDAYKRGPRAPMHEPPQTPSKVRRHHRFSSKVDQLLHALTPKLGVRRSEGYVQLELPTTVGASSPSQPPFHSPLTAMEDEELAFRVDEDADDTSMIDDEDVALLLDARRARQVG